MSYIFPKDYKTIVENLALAYASIRDGIYAGTALTTPANNAFTKAQAGLDVVLNADDNNTSSTPTVDPDGSIGYDLSSTWFAFAHTTVNEAKAKSVASSLFASAIKKLNDHCYKRTGQTNYNAWLSTYAYNAGNANLTLFGDGMTDPLSSYFSADFVELSGQIGVVIPTQFRA